MKIFTVPFFLLLCQFMQAQYYYDDIVGTRETNQQMKTWLGNKVRSVSATGTDNNGVKSTAFSEFYEVKENGRALKMTRISNRNKTIVYSQFDDQIRVISIADSFSAIRNTTIYEYDVNGSVAKVQNTVKDSANDFNQVETHTWIYNSAGKPEKMWRVIQNTGATTGTDSVEVRFSADADSNIADERMYKRGIETNFLYYYYDDQNRLSDIVRFNKNLKKLIPEIMFEHDEQDRVIQKITTTSDRVLGYLIWRYIFNDKGLKTKEALFNNDKQLTGKIDYSYTFGQ